jgi:hypothetical protein
MQVISLVHYSEVSFVLQIATKKFKNWEVQNYTYARWFVWVQNVTADIEGGNQAEYFENWVLRSIFGPKRN